LIPGAKMNSLSRCDLMFLRCMEIICIKAFG
jgi:hypothetical protein